MDKKRPTPKKKKFESLVGQPQAKVSVVGRTVAKASSRTICGTSGAGSGREIKLKSVGMNSLGKGRRISGDGSTEVQR